MAEHFFRQLPRVDGSEARIIFHETGLIDLAAGKLLFQDDGLKLGPRGIKPRRKTPRSGADDDDVEEIAHTLTPCPR